MAKELRSPNGSDLRNADHEEAAERNRSAASGVQSFRRSAALVNALAAAATTEPHALTLGQLAEHACLAKSTVHRLLAGLIAEGWVNRDEEGRYRLGEAFTGIGRAAAAANPDDRHLRESLGRLSAISGDTAFHTAREGTLGICTHRAEGTGPFRNNVLHPGDRHPLGLGAGALAILAVLPEDEATRIREANRHAYGPDSVIARIEQSGELEDALAAARERGYALNPGMLIAGSWAVGMPLLDSTGVAVGALSIATIEHRLGPDRIPELVRLLKTEVQQLSAAVDTTRSPSKETR